MTQTLAFDAAVPQRDELLDTHGVACRIARRTSCEIEAAEVVRVKYRIGEGIRVAFRVRVAGAERMIAAQSFAPGVADIELRRALRHATPTPPLPAVWFDTELDAVFWSFPNDRKLRSLASFAGDDSTRLVSYAPGKSATAARDGAFVKIYADDAADTTLRVHAELEGAAAFDVPAVVGYDPRQRTLTVAAARGVPLGSLGGRSAVDAVEALGAALAALHARPAPLWLLPFARLEPARVAHAAELVAQGRPDVAADSAALARELRDRFAPSTASGFLHGDVHPKNVFVTADGRVTFIDLDGASAGAPEAELGSAVAGLRYLGIVGSLPAGRAHALERALLDGYRRAGGATDASLGWHVGAALLAERALRAVNRVRPLGLHHLRAVLAGARAAVAEVHDD